MSVSANSQNFQPDIQGLRAIAVCLVIIYHSGLPGIPGGYVGVDVFFVISGYLITGLLLREIEQTTTISLSWFYARRFRRLLPAATLVLLATVAVAWFEYSPLALKQFTSSAFATAVYLSNVWFAHLSTDYLAEDADANPLLHTWSLGVEEQFYLLWPLLILLVIKLGRPEGVRLRLMFAFAGLAAGSFALSFWLTRINQPWAFFGSPTRAWEFAIGGLVAIWFARGRSLGPRGALLAGWCGLTMILISAGFYDRNTPFPGAAAVLPVVGAALLVAAANTRTLRGVSVLLACGPMRLAGDMSYSLYLWHWPVFVFFGGVDGADYYRSAVNLLVVFLLSWLTLVFVENPVRLNQRLSSQLFRSLALGATLTAVSASIAFGVRALAETNLGDPLQQKFSSARTDISQIYEDGCHLEFTAIEPGDCDYGDRESEFVIVLFGDSHAAQWFPPLHLLAEKKGWKLLSRTKSACPSIFNDPFDTSRNRRYTECIQWRKNVMQLIGRINPDVVVVSNSYSYMGRRTSSTAARNWTADVSGLMAALSPISRNVVLLRDTPRSNGNLPECLSRANWLGQELDSKCRVFLPNKELDLIYQAEREAASKFGNVHVLDLNKWICETGSCPGYSGDQVMLSDQSHLSRTFSMSLEEKLFEELRAIGVTTR